MQQPSHYQVPGSGCISRRIFGHIRFQRDFKNFNPVHPYKSPALKIRMTPNEGRYDSRGRTHGVYGSATIARWQRVKRKYQPCLCSEVRCTRPSEGWTGKRQSVSEAPCTTQSYRRRWDRPTHDQIRAVICRHNCQSRNCMRNIIVGFVGNLTDFHAAGQDVWN